ncbi:hypothetical protein ApDm4_2343 [Acetobacter pomorum]|nr:hypothetical protein ApDm4_2343 [Acetobacter pomorum]
MTKYHNCFYERVLPTQTWRTVALPTQAPSSSNLFSSREFSGNVFDIGIAGESF